MRKFNYMLFITLCTVIATFWACYYMYQLREARNEIAFLRSANTQPLPNYRIAEVLKRDTVKGFYKYSIIGESDKTNDADSLINAFTLYSRNSYKVGRSITTYNDDQIIW